MQVKYMNFFFTSWAPAHLPSLPHPVTLTGDHVPLGIIGGVGQPASVLSSPHHAPPAIVCALLALTYAPQPSLVLPQPSSCSPIHHSCSHSLLFVHPTHSQFVFIHAYLTSHALSLHLLLPLPLCICAPLCCLCCLCWFDLACLRFAPICTCLTLCALGLCSPLFVPPDAIPNVVAAAHTHALCWPLVCVYACPAHVSSVCSTL